jgi:hypothetical protein
MQSALRKRAFPNGCRPLPVGANGTGNCNGCSARCRVRSAHTPSPAAARAPAARQSRLISRRVFTARLPSPSYAAQKDRPQRSSQPPRVFQSTSGNAARSAD